MLRKLIAVNGRYFYLFLFSGLAINLPIIAFAQSDTTYKLKQVNVSDKSKITAVKPVQTINSDSFIKTNANNVADALKNFSGVNIKDYGGIGGLKTISVRSLNSNQVGVLYDGIAITDAQNGQVDLGKLSLNNIQEINLFNSQPDNLLLPAKAFASSALVSIKPNIPVFEKNSFKLNIGFKTGSFGLIEPSINYQQKINERWSATLNGYYIKADGKYKYKVFGDGSTDNFIRTNGDVTTYQTETNVNYHNQENEQFNLRINYFNSERGLPGAVIFYNDNAAQRLHNKDFFIQGKYQKLINTKWQILLNGKISQTNTYYVDPNYLNATRRLEQNYHQQEYYFSGASTYQFKSYLKVAYAIDGSINQLQTNLYQFTYPTRFGILQNLATEFSLNRLRLQANLLHTYITEQVTSGNSPKAQSIFTPAISLNYQLNNGLFLRAFYKNIFRMPTFNDLYYTRVGNIKLNPEYAKQYNLGVTYLYSFNSKNSVQFTADAYYNTIKDKIIAIPNKDLFTWSMINLGLVDIRGADLGLQSKIYLTKSYNFQFATNYTYQDAVDLTDRTSSTYLNQIPYTAKHTIASNLGIENDKWGIFYNYIYSSDRYYTPENLDRNLVSGFGISDASVNYKFKISKSSATTSLEVNNIFDHDYAIVRGFPMPGRSVRISFQIKI